MGCSSSDASIREFRIAAWPPVDQFNAYYTAFYDALRPYGVVWCGAAEVARKWLVASSGSVEALHFHFPTGMWEATGKSAIQRASALAGLFRYLRLARKMGIKIIYTLHDLDRHDGIRWDWSDWIGFGILARCCDLIVTHSDWAAVELRRRLRTNATTILMPHGNYVGYYPKARDRETQLLELGLDPGKQTLCCVGNMRHSKGLDLAVKAVRSLRNEIQLIIAGPPNATFDLAGLKQEMRHLNGGVIIPEELTIQAYSDIVEACDAVLLPYRSITSSGALLSALSLGRGVIASDLPYFREVCAPEPSAATFFRVGDAAAMSEAIRKCLSVRSDLRNDAAQRLANTYSWQRVVAPVGKFIQTWSDC